MKKRATIFFTRREFLRASSTAAATAVLLPQFPLKAQETSGGSSPVSAVMTRLSDYMGAAKEQPLPAPVAEQAKLHILDTFGAMISGISLPPARVALRFAKSHMGEQTATVIGTRLLCSPIEAAVVNGMLAHSDETDDSHAPSHSHPGCAVVPAAYASGEAYGVSGEHFLKAVVLGYDIGPRVLMMLGASDFQTRTHHDAHSMANTFGACAAAGCTAGLNAQQMRWLLDLASQQAAGIAAWQRDSEHIEKSLVFGGMPARDGVMTADLIRLGATGVDDVFSGLDNFLEAFSSQADPKMLVDGLGTRYEVSRTNIKKWTVGSPIQAPLDALGLILRQHSLHCEQIKSVVVRIATSGAKTVDNRSIPDICLQHMVAVMLVDGTVSFEAAHDRMRMKDLIVLRERAKVVLKADEELERILPKLVSVVDVTLENGHTYSQRVDAVRGTVANPMSREEVIAKFKDLTKTAISSVQCDRLVDSILHLENIKILKELRPVLQLNT